MKTLKVFFLLSLLSFASFAQKPVKMRPVWYRPQVHMVVGNVDIAISIHDINSTLKLLYRNGNGKFPDSMELDTSLNYSYEMPFGLHPEYHYEFQRLLKNGIGAFLLYNGRAVVKVGGKIVTEIIANTDEPGYKVGDEYCTFYMPTGHKQLFEGYIPKEIFGKDLSIDDD